VWAIAAATRHDVHVLYRVAVESMNGRYLVTRNNALVGVQGDGHTSEVSSDNVRK
jgi:hypothetical protein